MSLFHDKKLNIFRVGPTKNLVKSLSNPGEEPFNLGRSCDNLLPQLSQLRLELLIVLRSLVVGFLELLLVLLLADGVLPPELRDLGDVLLELGFQLAFGLEATDKLCFR